jgi:hypothetical protein
MFLFFNKSNSPLRNFVKYYQQFLSPIFDIIFLLPKSTHLNKALDVGIDGIFSKKLFLPTKFVTIRTIPHFTR